VVAVALGVAPQRREVGARLGLGHALAPDVVAAQHRTEEALLLVGRAVGHDRRRDVGHADRVHGTGRAGPGHLLVAGELVEQVGVATSVLRRPGDGAVARVDQRRVPGPVPVERLDGVGHRRGEVLGEPRPQLGPERVGHGRSVPG
jgi:hypothetical protein